jgi:tetratricopeptide (TPR) repeat protein
LASGAPDVALRVADITLAKHPKDVAALIAKGDALYAMGDTEAAKAAYRSAIALDPGAADAQLGLGRTLVRPGLPPMSLFVTGQWMVYRQFAPVAPQTTINFGLTVAFPQIRDYFAQ